MEALCKRWNVKISNVRGIFYFVRGESNGIERHPFPESGPQTNNDPNP